MLSLGLTEFERKAKSIGGVSTKCRSAGALNDALFKARDRISNNSPPHSVTVRNSSFVRAALQVEKATKANLSGAVAGRLGRASLKLRPREARRWHEAGWPSPAHKRRNSAPPRACLSAYAPTKCQHVPQR